MKKTRFARRQLWVEELEPRVVLSSPGSLPQSFMPPLPQHQLVRLRG